MSDETLSHLLSIEKENSFHCLLETRDPLLEILSREFCLEPNPERRRALVRLAWQRGEPGTSQLLALALEDHDPVVWKEALDGLVSVRELAGAEILKQAHSGSEGDKRQWIEEAISQIPSGHA